TVMGLLLSKPTPRQIDRPALACRQGLGITFIPSRNESHGSPGSHEDLCSRGRTRIVLGRRQRVWRDAKRGEQTGRSARRRLGAKLLVRSTRAIALTRAGEAFFPE